MIGYLEIGKIIYDTVAQRIGFRGIDKLCGRTPISRIGYFELLNIGSYIYCTGISSYTVEIGSTDRNFLGRQTTIDKACLNDPFLEFETVRGRNRPVEPHGKIGISLIESLFDQRVAGNEHRRRVIFGTHIPISKAVFGITVHQRIAYREHRVGIIGITHIVDTVGNTTLGVEIDLFVLSDVVFEYRIIITERFQIFVNRFTGTYRAVDIIDIAVVGFHLLGQLEVFDIGILSAKIDTEIFLIV